MSAGDAPPNIVLVTVDSLRADRCGWLDDTSSLTPTLDDWAADGVVFEQAIAAGPSTPESMPTAFTGTELPLGTLPHPDDNDGRRSTIRRHLSTRMTIPERLSRQGYATGGFTPNPYTSRYFGFDRGFDRFQDFMDTDVKRWTFDVVKRRVGPLARAAFDWTFQQRSFKRWESFIDEVVAWTRSVEEPYFVWILLMDTHTPYFVPRRHRSTNSWWEMTRATWRLQRSDYESHFGSPVHDQLVSAYDDTVAYADDCFAHLDAALGESDPVVVVHSDHGEAFFEHGSYYHRVNLYEENLHVPLLIANAGRRERVDTPIGLHSLPRIVETLAADGDPTTVASGRPVAASSADGERFAIRADRWKLIASASGLELYDLEADPKEGTDLAPDRPGVVRECLESAAGPLGSDRERHSIASHADPVIAGARL